jgi:3-oxoadipate enol-lactonase
MPFADLPEVRLHYRIDGPEAGATLVLSNSLGTDFEMWAPQVEALSARFRVLRYDTRGHGQSSVPPGEYTIAQLGRDVLALLDFLHFDRVQFAGLSMGGMTGMWLGVHAPERITTLTLANTAARIAPPELWNTRIEKVNAGGMAAISDAVLGRWFTQDFSAREPARIVTMKTMLERTPAAGYAACCAAIRDMDQREAVAAIPAPTLVIAGTHDEATPPADGRFLATTIGDARYIELPAAHLSNIETAPAFTAALVDFLRD